MANKYPKGSIWRRWDLHVHTPASYDWKGGDISAKDLVDKVKELGLEVVAVTDHHSVEWVDAISEEGRKQGITILPGFEIRTDKGNKGIHIIGIFKEGTSAKTIYDKVLSPLHFTHDDIKQKGDEQIYTEYKDACELIRKEGGLIFLHAGNKHCGIEQLDSDAQSLLKKDMAYMVDALEISEQSQLMGYQDKVFPNINQVLPVIVSSDGVNRSDLAHNKGHSLDVLGKKFSWIKADPTFEGLKQIVHEPELRVRLQGDDPTENETYARIEECKIALPDNLKILTDDSEKKESDFCLQGEYALNFSNNLTCIIGGRGSGKSTLVHILFNSWRKKDESRLHNIGSPLLNLDLSHDPLAKARNATTVDIPEDTEFFLQNEIEKHAQNVGEMSNLIRYRLEKLSRDTEKKSLKELGDAWNATSSKMDELVSAYEIISESNKKIEGLQKNINTLRKQTEVRKSKEYRKHQKSIEEVSEKIATFRKYQKEYDSLIESMKEIEEKIKSLSWDNNKGGDVLAEFLETIGSQKQNLSEKFEKAKEEYDKNNYPDSLKTKKHAFKKYLEGKGMSPENIEELADATEQINSLESQIAVLEEERKPYDDLYAKLDDILTGYKNTYISYRDRFFEVGSRLEKDLASLPLSDKKISFEQKINERPLRDSAADFVKKNVSEGIPIKADEIQNVLFDTQDLDKYVADKSYIKKSVNDSQKAAHHRKVLRELVNDDVFLNRLYLRIYKSFFNIDNIQVQTKLGEKLLQNTSFGERCGIVITIALLAGTNPIVIDQPEDNLDGKFIATVLVPLIRKQKESRQIILVTRDANIAIGSDVELIVILDNDGGGKRMEFVPSTIENTENREKYIWILDGGEAAFQKREQKYSIKPQRIWATKKSDKKK